MTSTTLPLPSSPHGVPTTTMLGMTAPSCGFSKMLLRTLQDLADRQRPLGAAGQVERQQLAGLGARAADDQHVTHPLGARVGDRLLEPAADDIARDRGATVAQAAGQRQGYRLLRREVDDEE